MSDRSRGILCILGAALSFALMNTFVQLSGGIPTMQKAFFRNFVAVIFSFLILKRNRISFQPPEKRHWLLLLARAAFGTLGLLCNFYAVDHLNISDASMLNKMAPFFAILVSYFLLRESLNLFQGLIVIAAFLGYMFTRDTLWKRKLWFRLVAATMYFNAGIIPWFITMKNLHLTNNFWGYVLPMAVQPFYIILCKTFVESVPHELQDAAEIDGAGTLKVFFYIIVPVIKPILATIAIFAAVAQWNAFQDTLLLVTDPKLYTLQFVLYQYINQASSLKSLVNNATSGNLAASLAHAQTATSIRMTVSVVVVTPIMLVYPFFQRYFTKGIMIGAVKG